MVKLILAACVLTACVSYDARFDDCTIHCTVDTGCPDGLTCGAEGLCRSTDSTCALQSSSCDGLAAICGPTASDDCCATATTVPSGTFYRSHDVAADGMYPSTNYPATVSTFVLDKYEVTVGRFRAFVNAGMGTQATAPAQGAGGRTLNGLAAQGGWEASWNGSLSVDTASLKTSVQCDSTRQTWTDTTSVNDSLPMNCITWYEAVAFCAWDGGHLPTEAEWNYATSGGDEQRAYPWSTPAGDVSIDCSYANYNINTPSGTYCVNGTTGATNRVGSESPKGDGKWGQSDLGGNVQEWTLDSYAAPYPQNSCTNCANLTTGAPRALRGGSLGTGVRAATRGGVDPMNRSDLVGVRCARTL